MSVIKSDPITSIECMVRPKRIIKMSKENWVEINSIYLEILKYLGADHLVKDGHIKESDRQEVSREIEGLYNAAREKVETFLASGSAKKQRIRKGWLLMPPKNPPNIDASLSEKGLYWTFPIKIGRKNGFAMVYDYSNEVTYQILS